MSDPVSTKLGYHPLWLETLSADVVLEGSVLNGQIQGAEIVKEILGFARSLYDFQRFSFLGNVGEDYWMETYTSKVKGTDIINTAIVHRNAGGETDHIAMTHRPLGALHLFSSLLREEFGDRFPPAFFYDLEPSIAKIPDA